MLSNRIASNNIEIYCQLERSAQRQSQTKAVAWFFPARFQGTEWGAAETVDTLKMKRPPNTTALSPQALEKERRDLVQQ